MYKAINKSIFRLVHMNNILLLISISFFSCTTNNSIEQNSQSKLTTTRLLQEAVADSNEKLFIIIVNDHFGFINEKGEVVIEVKFKDAMNFSEGLASARIGGKYGYINHKGEFVIKPNYDYATNFIQGIAIIYQEGSPGVINRNGKYLVKPNTFKNITAFSDGVSIVESEGGLFGGINTEGKLIIDTIYKEITTFNSNRAIVTGVNHPNDIRVREQQIGVIDTKGNFVVKYGVYFNVYRFNKGYAKVEVFNNKYDDYSGWSSEEGIIDTSGKLLFKTSHSIERDVYEGFVKANIGYYKDVLLNLKGESFLDKLQFQYIENINEGFVINWDMNQYQVVNIEGISITKDVFARVTRPGVRNGVAIVQDKNGKWGLIDTLGKYILETKYQNIHTSGLINNRIFYGEELGEGYDYKWGILNLEGDTVCEAKFTKISYQGFLNDIMYVEQDSISGYINKDGEFVWSDIQKNDKNEVLNYLNSSFMNRAYCFVDESKDHDTEDKYEWVSYPKNTNNKFPLNKFGIVVDTSKKAVFSDKYYGFTAYVFNSTKDAIEVEVQDGRLSLKMQVKDIKGEWKDIEYIPSSWCGNSYYKVNLLSKEYWEVQVPIYKGEMEVEARLRLVIDDTYKEGKLISETVLYSNTFRCSINPGQFWNKRGYSPKGIMDPYLE